MTVSLRLLKRMSHIMPSKLKPLTRRLYFTTPSKLKPLARRLYFGRFHWAHPALRKFGTVQDLYYWVADGRLDTLLVLQNYFSALFPSLNTETVGTISIYDNDGTLLGHKSFSVGHCGGVKFRLSSLLQEIEPPPDQTFGTVEVKIAIPPDVLSHIRDQQTFYFWDRFYIGYTDALGQISFVHGVDKTHIYREGASDPSFWYQDPGGHEWAPETPVDIDRYERFSVVMINRTSQKATATLILSDVNDESLSWNAVIQSKGVHRFQLTRENTQGLSPTELRMRIQGMSSQYGRPIVFKEFSNGTISAVHC